MPAVEPELAASGKAPGLVPFVALGAVLSGAFVVIRRRLSLSAR